jgi:hypothetical protein
VIITVNWSVYSNSCLLLIDKVRVVYHETIRESYIKAFECRCDARLKDITEGCTYPVYTGLSMDFFEIYY